MSTKVLKNLRLIVSIRRTLFLIFILTGFVAITGCGSSISNVELPEDFIRDFLAKHETMVDKSLVYYYTKVEQPAIAEKIDLTCRLCKNRGTLESLEKATFDFSGLMIELLDKKEEYINDEPVLFVKVAVKGNYIMELPEESKKIDANDVIILRMARHEWKVTETSNPWS